MKIFSDISQAKLREIFELMLEGNDKVSRGDLIQLVETFFQEFVFSAKIDLSHKEDFTAGVENLKCILNEISKLTETSSFLLTDICNGRIIRNCRQPLRKQNRYTSSP
jgi:hypothetical protein